MNYKFLIMIVCCFIFIAACEGKTISSDKTIDFTLPDLEGKNVSLSDYLGEKVVLLVFGATWCPHCRNEIPELKAIYEKFKRENFVLLYIDIGESKEKVSSFAEKYSLPYTVLLDKESKVASSYKVYGIPYAFLIDKKGKIVFKGGTPKGFLSGEIERLLR